MIPLPQTLGEPRQDDLFTRGMSQSDAGRVDLLKHLAAVIVDFAQNDDVEGMPQNTFGLESGATPYADCSNGPFRIAQDKGPG